MSLQIIRKPPGPAGFVADRRLYLTADKLRVVEEGNAEAAWLLCAPGQSIPLATCEALGLSLVDDRVVQGEPEAEPVAEPEPEEAAAEDAPAKKKRKTNGE